MYCLSSNKEAIVRLAIWPKPIYWGFNPSTKIEPLLCFLLKAAKIKNVMECKKFSSKKPKIQLTFLEKRSKWSLHTQITPCKHAVTPKHSYYWSFTKRKVSRKEINSRPSQNSFFLNHPCHSHDRHDSTGGLKKGLSLWLPSRRESEYHPAFWGSPTTMRRRHIP